MKEYILIKGLSDNTEEFENQIALSQEQGYELSGDLITHVISNKDNTDVVILLQPMYLSDNTYDN